jgi:RNA polymerase-binding transcription factor DksA
MAAKKTTSKPVSSKGKAAPAAQTKKSAPAKKTPAKKAAPAKKVAPVKKAVSEKKVAPVKKPAPTKEVAPVKKVVISEKVAAAPGKPTAASKVSGPSSAKTTRSSLANFTVPPAPIKPPFVPPKTATSTTSSNASGTNGIHHSPSFVKKQRQRLLDLRDDLVDAMSGMTRDTIRNAPEGSEASGSGQHQGDAGSDAYDRDFALSVLAKEQDALYEIEQALRRIQSGSYGVCEMSSHKIPIARLEAIPFARLTVECQAQWEKEYGKRRFRPSNEVGFSGGNYIEDEDSETVSLDEEED